MRWGLAPRRLPAGSDILNRDISFFERHRWVLLGSVIVVALETFIIILLLVNRAARRRAQAALRINEERYRQLFEAAGDIIMIVNAGGAIRHANPAASAKLGLPGDLLCRKKLDDLVPPSRHAELRRHLGRAARGERALWELTCVAAAGAEVPVEMLLQPMEYAGTTAVLCVARDLTERFKIQRLTQEISERERQAIGWDIHDGLGQYISALTFQCNVLEQRAGRGQAIGTADVQKLSTVVSELAFETRSLARSMVPFLLLSNSLYDALKELMELNARHFGLQTAMECALPEGEVSPETAAHLYRITQEGMRNAARHAGARQVKLSLAPCGEGRAALRMENDGRPFEALPERRVGMGLAIMEQRARLIGARLQIRSDGEGRTVLACDFPLASNPSEVSA